MSRRSRRAKKSRRNVYIGAIALILVVVAAGGYYALYGRGGAATTTSSAASSSSTSLGSGQYAILDTTQGTIVVQLFPQNAPKTVANFVSLADSGFYNNLVWHRIVAGFIIQTGDPNTRGGTGSESTWGQGGSGTTIPFENTGLPEGQYYVAMANTSPQGNGASSQFFINLADNTASLGSGYAVFGLVVQGTSAVQALAALPVASTCSSSGGLTCPPIDPSQAMLISVTIQNTP
jgi:cyclophilin family peptidyl-prolyl cis-trans isomerase